MTTKRPRTTISFDDDEYAELQEWANSEYRTIPQLVLVFVKKALDERRVMLVQDPTTAKPAPKAIAKRGRPSASKK